MTPVSIIHGTSPIVLAQPHSGTFLPSDIKGELNDHGRQLLDTDWHIPELYDDLLPDATYIRANFNRYVIDANRDPDGQSLYPGQNTTELVPLTTFDGVPIWNTPPTDEDISIRLREFHSTYHNAVHMELQRVKQQYGFAILYDCHSIRSNIPHLFEGQLPDLNIGTNGGVSCALSIAQAIMRVCEDQDDYTYVLNGRFKGGWTTRHYGKPDDGIHAVQMEISQHTYLQSETPPFAYDETGAAKLRDLLRTILTAIQRQAEIDF